MVAPSGNTNETISFLPPSFVVQSMFNGKVPTDDALQNAITIAGAIPLKNFIGPTFAILETITE